MSGPSDDWKSAFFAALAGTAVSNAKPGDLVLKASEIADAAAATIRGRTEHAQHEADVKRFTEQIKRGLQPEDAMSRPVAVAVQEAVKAAGHIVEIQDQQDGKVRLRTAGGRR